MPIQPAVEVVLPSDDESPAAALAHRERHQPLPEPGLYELTEVQNI